MRATGEIQVIPIGVGVSLSGPVKRAHRIITTFPLKVVPHAQGSNVEGELSDILAAVQAVHEALHQQGVPRISTSLKLGTRIDKESSLDAKLQALGE